MKVPLLWGRGYMCAPHAAGSGGNPGQDKFLGQNNLEQGHVKMLAPYPPSVEVTLHLDQDSEEEARLLSSSVVEIYHDLTILIEMSAAG
ncbi:hypothetical protein C0J52_01942 [Blattella germanica]|nr:hypothetical protein C0J52_01942 [Blattella germanica]